MEALLELNPDNIYLDKEFAGKDVSKYKKIGTHTFSTLIKAHGAII